MMEMQLIAKIDQCIYKEAWSALVPKIWEFCSCSDMADEQNKTEEDDVLDEGNKHQHFSQISNESWC